MKRRIIARKALAVIAAFAIAFTGLPTAAGSLEASAASPYWRNLKAKATSETTVKLSWKKLTKKQRSKITGIVVYRNGKKIKKLKKTATRFTDRNLKPGKTYKYKIKVRTKVTKKTKKYWNKKTGKWQKKKIKGARIKWVKKTSYKYGHVSKVKTVKTKEDMTDDLFDGMTLKSVTLKVGETKTYTVKSRKTVTWKSSKPSVATVSSKGKVKAVAAGKTTITATNWNGATKTATVTVEADEISPDTPAPAVTKYTIVWRNWDNSTIRTDEVAKGVTPSYKGQAPVREADSSYTYTFSGWSPDIAPATKDQAYTAQFTKKAKTMPSDPATPSDPSDPATPSDPTDPSTPSDPTDPSDPQDDEVTYTGRTKTITDYLGNTETYRELTNGKWELIYNENSYQLSYESMMNRINDPYYNREIDGEFYSNSDGNMIQLSGATFKKAELYGQEPEKFGHRTDSMPTSERWYIEYGFVIHMWGGNDSKLTYESDHPLSEVASYGVIGVNEFKPKQVRYFDSASSGRHLITLVNSGIYYDVKGTTAPYALLLNFKTPLEPSCGFASEDITFTVKYDGVKIGEIVWNPNPNAVNGLHPNKALAYSIAQQAIAAKGRSTASDELTRCCQEMYKIRDYIEETYYYGEEVTGEGGGRLQMGCEGCASVMEAWTVMEYGYDGFWGCKNQDPFESGHRSWNLNLDPTLQFDGAGHQ